MENKIYVEMTIEELNAFKDFKENKNKTELSVDELVSMLFSKTDNVKYGTGINPNTMQKYYEETATIDLENGHLYISHYGYERNDK